MKRITINKIKKDTEEKCFSLKIFTHGIWISIKEKKK